MDELDEIVEIIKNKKCIPFLGAGISRIAGCSDWNTIPIELEKINEIKQGLEQGVISVPQDAPREKKIEIYLDHLNSLDKKYLYGQILRDVVTCDAAKISGDYMTVVRSLEKIYSYSKILLTTNIDNCLEMAKDTVFVPRSAIVYYNVEDFDISRLRDGGIFCIHGHRDSFSEAVFTGAAFADRYSDKGFSNFLYHIFQTYTILFIGYSLKDKQLLEVIEKVKDRKHFALIRRGEYTPEEKTNFLERYNIQLVEYPDHNQLPSLLQKWTDSNFPDISVVEATEEEVRNV